MRYADAPARRGELLRRLQMEGYVSSATLAVELGVSEMTIRRDLRQLHDERLVRRVAGGASLPQLGHGVPFEERETESGTEKLALTAATLPLLADATTVLLDAGTTVAPLARSLPPGTTIVSHSAPVIAAAVARDDVDLVAIGGEYQRGTRSFTGQSAREALAGIAADVAVVSATGVDASGVLCTDSRDAEIKRLLIDSTPLTVLVVDSSKLGLRAPLRVARLTSVDVVVTSTSADLDLVRMIERAGPRVVLAPIDAAGAAS